MKKMLSILLFISCTAFLSCNNEDKKAESTSKDSTATTTTIERTNQIITLDSLKIHVANKQRNAIDDLHFPVLKLDVNWVLDMLETSNPNQRIYFQFEPLNISGAINKFGLVAFKVNKDRETSNTISLEETRNEGAIATKYVIFGLLELTNKQLNSIIPAGTKSGYLLFTPKPSTSPAGYVVYTVGYYPAKHRMDYVPTTTIETNPSPPAKPNPEDPD